MIKVILRVQEGHLNWMLFGSFDAKDSSDLVFRHISFSLFNFFFWDFLFFFSKSLSPDCLQAKKILLKLQIILNSKYPLMSQNQESLHRNWYLEGTREFHFIFFSHSQVFLCHAEEMGKKSASSLYCFKSSGSYNKSCHVLLWQMTPLTPKSQN